ncbi:MAG: glycosyl transferase [Phycisphaera sp.]|nr:glycosyl transferase [Phycisphaera sp.]
MRHYCTYFDHRYLPRAMVLYESLCRHEESFVLHALCLSREAQAQLMRLAIPNLRPISLQQLERAYPALLDAKANRSAVEYYFTCTPALALYVLEHVGGVESVTYLDSDLCFFASPEPIYRELGDGSVAIIEHRYPESLRHLGVYGKYNVGLLVFKNDLTGLLCLRDWHEQCLDWCYEKIDHGRYADQGYLDSWKERYKGIVEIQNHGANAAPWNLADAVIREEDGCVAIDGDPLIFYHFHRLKIVTPHLFDPGLHHYGVGHDPVIVQRVYAPYLAELRAQMRRFAVTDTGNLRLTSPVNRRDIARLLLYGHTLLQFGPITTPVHAEPYLRPILALREATMRGMAMMTNKAA